MKRLYYFADQTDHQQLRTLIDAQGAQVFPWRLGEMAEVETQDFSEKPLCFISLKPLDQLKVHEIYKDQLSFGDNPILRWNRAYFKSSFLVAGDIEYTEIPKHLEAYFGVEHEDVLAIRSVYRKISAFVRSNWRDVRNDGFYFGPSAERRHLEDGVQAASFMPGTMDMVEIEVPSDP